ncbi:hypothetical protein BDV96DRAFT_576709 [Lophiotrema nucula]|uniref:Polyprenal reductase n=1 Tax=Lophiotrema nucula TaxID=690887 RepID=A0A6A5Z4X7_9PLEO|nr:hypothetical protein BDV96DRAFT_576709 [Lophiotrema nucula]
MPSHTEAYRLRDMSLLWQLQDPVLLLRLFYLAASALIFVIQAVPALRSRFLAYGSRATPPSSQSSDASKKQEPSAVVQALDHLASLRVPHRWFTHFYVVSVACSVLWGIQMWRTLSISPVYKYYPSWEVGISYMSMGQIQLAWLLMLLQGVRRLVESYQYTSSSKSQMWFGHYILGILFYVTVNMAIWVEGPCNFWHVGCHGAFVQENDRMVLAKPLDNLNGFVQKHQWKVACLVPAILTAHALQHMYHAYLYRLRTETATYQLPSHPMFPNLLCPHYTCEIAIYLLLSFLAAPTGSPMNWTLLCATVFVTVNLGVTASGTKEWYVQRFGADKVETRNRMILWLW